MDKLHISQHISQQFNEELEEVRSRVMEMGGMVEQQLADAVRALTDGNNALAEKVMVGDYQVNAMEVDLDEQCTQILARRQPAASDLRLVMAVVKAITDLERIGDEAERIGRMAAHIGKEPLRRAVFVQVGHLGDMVRRMLHQALDAFARLDVELAMAVAESDRTTDREYESVLRQLITFMMEDPRSIPAALNILWSARALERIGDRSRNICEYVVYLVQGKDIRHTSLEQVKAELKSRTTRP